jgi:hypothetical protein
MATDAYMVIESPRVSESQSNATTIVMQFNCMAVPLDGSVTAVEFLSASVGINAGTNQLKQAVSDAVDVWAARLDKVGDPRAFTVLKKVFPDFTTSN